MSHQFFLSCPPGASNLRIHPSSLEFSDGGARGQYALWTAEEIPGSVGAYVLSNAQSKRIVGVRRDGSAVVLEKEDAEGVAVRFESTESPFNAPDCLMVRIVDAETNTPLKFKQNNAFKLDATTTLPMIHNIVAEASQQLLLPSGQVGGVESTEAKSPTIDPPAPAASTPVKALKCPSGHELVVFGGAGVAVPFDRYTCDVCANAFAAHLVPSQRCSQCDFDVCLSCVLRRQSGAPMPPPPRGGVPMMIPPWAPPAAPWFGRRHHPHGFMMEDFAHPSPFGRGPCRDPSGNAWGPPRHCWRPHGAPWPPRRFRPWNESPQLAKEPEASGAEVAVEVAPPADVAPTPSEPRQLRCPSGHELEISRGPLATASKFSYAAYICDLCGSRRSAREDAVAHCRDCAFDVCPDCQPRVLSGELDCSPKMELPKQENATESAKAPVAAAEFKAALASAGSFSIVTSKPSRITFHPNGDVTVAAITEEEALRATSA